ncbi:hypothetical protein NIES2100_16120 [Calothrix sp. NIES-2100]|nr:hypothetical protein NIES2100_16120 [Calothrix sp. NIES-2100]
MLKGVACKYGMSSNEYEMAGGSKKQKRKCSTPKATTPTDQETTDKA